MNALSASLAALAVALSSTLCSQSLVEFEHAGRLYIGVPVETWEAIVSRRIEANQLNRERAISIVTLGGDVNAAKAKGETYRKDAEEAKANEVAALAKLNVFEDENRNLSRKLRRRTPWATAMKVEVGVLLAVGAFVTYQELKP